MAVDYKSRLGSRPKQQGAVTESIVPIAAETTTEPQTVSPSTADSSNNEILSLPAPAAFGKPPPSTLLSCGIFGRSWHYRLDNVRCARQAKSGRGSAARVEYESATCSDCIIECCDDTCLIGCCDCCFCGVCCGESEQSREEAYLKDYAIRNNKEEIREEGLANVVNQMKYEPTDPTRAYVMVGLFNPETGTVKERLVGIRGRKDLFKSIHKGANYLRPFFLRILSLKEIGGFSLYRCHPTEGYHTTVDLDSRTSLVLLQLFQEYSSSRYDFSARWKDWVFENLNCKSCNPVRGRYGLQLVLRWSTTKIVLYTSAPILLSLAVGLWYTLGHHAGADAYVVTQTAWTIASYIVTTAGGECISFSPDDFHACL